MRRLVRRIPLSAILFMFMAPLLVALILAPGPTHVAAQEPIAIEGNATCERFAPAGEDWAELKVEPPAAGTFSEGALDVAITNLTETSFSWTSNIGVDAVFVKGGPAGHLYRYDFETTRDAGLTPPVNPRNNKPYGISHISFCYDVDELPPEVDLNQSELETVDAEPEAPVVEVAQPQPGATNAALAITKSGPELSKPGDPVTYTYTIANTGEARLVLQRVEDDVLGDLTQQAAAAGCELLAPGAQCRFTADAIVPEAAADPLVNTVAATYTAEFTASARHTVNLFQPAITIDKSGPAEAQVGDRVTYAFTIANTGSDDSPDLMLDRVVDDILGDLTAQAAAAGCDVLPVGGECRFTMDTTIQAGTPDPLQNTVEALYHPDGFPNDVAAADDHVIDLVAALGNEGCTPGYWKQDQHFDSWLPTGYEPTDSFEAVFGVALERDVTLLEALNARGGGVNALLRAATAALLNAAHPDVAYRYGEAQVIDLVQDALLGAADVERVKNLLDAANNAGCPLN